MTEGLSTWTPLWAGVGGATFVALVQWFLYLKLKDDITRKFDIPITETMDHILSTDTSYASWEHQHKAEDEIAKLLYLLMCNGRIRVMGTRQEKGKEHVPERISRWRCRKMVLARVVVPRGPKAPLGTVFGLLRKPEEETYQIEEVYLGLRFQSREIYGIWPK